MLLGGPQPFRVVAVALFVLAAPGLVLTQALRIGDQLLSLVIGMVAGPALWVMVSVVAVFAHVWHPGAAVVGAAALLTVAAMLLLPSTRADSDGPHDDARHRFAAHLHDRVVVKAVGRHRGAFPSPYDQGGR